MTNNVSEEILPPPECGYYLNSIYFYLTQGCNLRCRHCWIAPEFQGTKNLTSKFIPFDLIKKIIEQGKALGLSSVKLTGGEPLIHPEIKEILTYLAKEKIRLILETNGVLCSKEIASLIKKCYAPTVSVSIDSPDADTHEWVRGVKGSYKKAVAGLKNLVSEHIDCQIIMSLMKKNVDHIESMVQLAEDLGVMLIKFNLITPTARGKKMHEKGETLTIKELIETGRWIDCDLSKRTEVELSYSHPMAFRPLSQIYGDAPLGLCGIKGIIGVLGSGKYALCGIGETVDEMVFGDAETDSLEEVWNSNSVLNKIRTSLPENLEGVCSDCLNKQICLGSCIASNYYQTQNLFAPFWFCDEAFKAGLFPQSRINPNSDKQK